MIHFLVGKTRTRDKYRIVYNDRQRYELENEYSTTKYISIPRKAALSSSLALSERQVSVTDFIHWLTIISDECLDQDLVSESSSEGTKIRQKTTGDLLATPQSFQRCWFAEWWWNRKSSVLFTLHVILFIDNSSSVLNRHWTLIFLLVEFFVRFDQSGNKKDILMLVAPLFLSLTSIDQKNICVGGEGHITLCLSFSLSLSLSKEKRNLAEDNNGRFRLRHTRRSDD